MPVALRGSDLRTDEPGLRLDHSHCSQFVAVGTTVAVREHFAFDIGFGIVPDIGIAGMGTVPGCIEADTLQWGSGSFSLLIIWKKSPFAKSSSWVLFGSGADCEPNINPSALDQPPDITLAQ